MPVKIRLARRGRKKQPFYHIVIADSRSPRDGKFIEQIGSYNPMTVPATIEIDRDRAFDWLNKGAQPTNTLAAILRFKGVMYRKHLARGVKKGAMTQEAADKLYNDFINNKEEKVTKRRESALAEKLNFWKQVSGEVKIVAKAAPAAMAAEFREPDAADEAAPATDVSAGAETAKVEAAPAVEVEVEAPAVEEAPAVAAKVEAEAPVVEAPAAKDEAPATQLEKAAEVSPEALAAEVVEEDAVAKAAAEEE